MNNIHPPSQQSPLSSIEEVHLNDYLAVILCRRKVVLAAFLAVFLGVALFTFFTKPVYEASATLHVRDDKVKGKGVLDDLGLSRENPIETEIEILKSRSNAEEVVRRLHLDWVVSHQSKDLDFTLLEFASSAEDPVYEIEVTEPGHFVIKNLDGERLASGSVGQLCSGGEVSLLLGDLRGKPGASFQLHLVSTVAAAEGLRSGYRASEVGKGTNIIQLSYRDTDPQRAKDVVNTLARVYLDRSVSLKSEEASKSVAFIETQLEEVRGLLFTAEQSLEGFKRATGVVRLDQEAQALIQRVAEVDKEHNVLTLRQKQLEFAIDSLKKSVARGETYFPSMLLEDAVVAELARRMTELEVEKRGLLVDFTEADPVARSLQDRIRELGGRLLAAYLSAQQSMAIKTEALEKELASYDQELKNFPQAEQELARLTRLATVNADIYTFLLQKHQEARIAKAATISSITVIDPAIAPNRPVKPNKKKNLLLGLIVGAMLGVGLAFFLEYLDNTLKDAEAAKKALGLPMLAVIPFIGQRPGRKRQSDLAPDQKRALVSQLAPKSGAAEAFRSLRTSLHFSSAGRDQKVFLVTSAFPGEGKTTIAANLAETMAQTGARVLLVGCDLRKPTLHTVFDCDRTPGLTEFLIGDVRLEKIIHHTPMPTLHFISGGTVPPNPAELVGSATMRDLVTELRSQYDAIILDAPPVLAVTDASLLTTIADQVLVVLEAGGVRLKAAQHMLEILHNAHAPLAGLVLNDKAGKGFEYYNYHSRYGKYGYGYGYGYGADEGR